MDIKLIINKLMGGDVKNIENIRLIWGYIADVEAINAADYAIFRNADTEVIGFPWLDMVINF